MADFSRLVKDASDKYKNENIAYVRVRLEGDKLKVHMQSLEVPRQFEGDVTYGRDIKGILFFDDELEFQVQYADFKYSRYGSGDLVAIEIKFYHRGDADPYATFISRVSPAQLPTLDNGEGNGLWTDFKVAASQTRVLRVGSNRVNLLFSALRKTAHFPSKSTDRIDSWGILLFADYKKLESSFHGKKLLVKISSDLLLFHLDGEPDDILAQFTPAGPQDVGSSEVYTETVTWEDFDSGTSASDKLAAEAKGTGN